MAYAFSAAPERQTFRERLFRRPLITGLVVGLLAFSLTACGGSDSVSSSPVGTLDKAFGKTGDGMVTVSLGAGNDSTNGMVVQADGKALLIGSSSSSSTVSGTTSTNITVERFNTDGTLDTSFGAGNSDGSPDGVVSLSLGNGNEKGTAIAVQEDGRIVIAGTTTSVSGNLSKNVVVARLKADGSMDSTFGTANDGTPDGVVNVSLSDGDDVANALTIQSDGKIVVAGTTSSTSGDNIAVVRLNTDGSLDTAFGAGTSDGSPDGVVTLSLGDGSDSAEAIAVQADGRLVVAGNSTATSGNGSKNIVVARLNTDGTMDAYFGTANDGSPDGVVNVSLSDGNDVAHALAIQSNGKILVAGTSSNASGNNAALVRLNADGSLDTGFGVGVSDGTPDGVVGLSLGNGDDESVAIRVQADGKIVVTGNTTSTGSSSNVFVARLLADGSLDTGFGNANDGTPDGFVNLSFGDGNDFARALALQADGKILVAGDRVNGNSSDITLARLLVN